ncbi:MAG: tetratricopeptide repeat protein [Campylobacterales bacterium]
MKRSHASSLTTPPLIDQLVATLKKGRYEEVREAALKLVQKKPTHAELWNLLGQAQKALGDLDGANESFQKALSIKETPTYLCNLASVTQDLKEAERLYRRALEVGGVDAHVLFLLAFCINSQGREEEAASLYQEVIALKSDYYNAYFNLGTILAKQGRHEEALRIFEAGEPFGRTHPSLYNNIGVVSQKIRSFDRAEQAYRKAIELKPDYVDALKNFAIMLKDLGRYDEAEVLYRRALAIDPHNPDLHWSLSLFLLLLGRYEEGWEHYEARYERLANRCAYAPSIPIPQWKGEPLEGKSILIWPEQGFGDQIQFVRYAALLKERGAKVTVGCVTALVPFIQTGLGVDGVIDLSREKTFERHDYWSFPLSLPLYFKTTLQTIPQTIPYLFTLPERVARWRPRLPERGLRVGLVWKGSVTHSNDSYRSLPSLAALAPLWEVEGISFISLQKGAGEEEAQHPPANQPLIHVGSDLEDFADTAAIVEQLDLLISVDTSIVHVAGALGRPAWVLLPLFGGDWRWLNQGDESPWYPGLMRLFRPSGFDWDECVERVKKALQEWRDRYPKDQLEVALRWHQQGQVHEAIRLYDGIIRLHPNHADALHYYGLALHQMGRSEEGLALIDRALRVKRSPCYLVNLGVIFKSLGRFEEAGKAYEEALVLNPKDVNGWYNYGNLLGQMGRYGEAEAAYRKGLALEPDNPEIAWNMALLLLRQGRLKEGWRYHEARYDARLRKRIVTLPPLPYPMWRGEPLQGRSILIWPEQGFGDQIIFVRFAALLKAHGASHVTLVCPKPLIPLFATCSGIDHLIELKEHETMIIPKHDTWTLPMSIPRWLEIGLEELPATLPYLRALPERLEKWRPRLPTQGFRVGLVWRGNPDQPVDIHRSLRSLTDLAPLWNVEGVCFISLQKGVGEEEAKHPPANQPLIHLGSDLEDFADTAAIIEQLDLVITTCTSTAHLAGALGKPCWVFVPRQGTFWLWMDRGEDSPWYPRVVRLFRQKQSGQWHETILEVAQALAKLVGKSHDQQLLTKAYKAHLQGDLTQAKAGYEAILAHNPHHAEALHLLGLIQRQEGNVEEAARLVGEAVALEPSAIRYTNYGVILKALGRYEEAKQAYSRALELSPTHADGWYNLGNLYRDTGKLQEAQEAYQQAINVAPGYIGAYNNLGWLYKEWTPQRSTNSL